MIDSNWESSGKHPPASALLLFLERELPSRESAAVERHMRGCWECRSEIERLQRGICGFVEYRNEVLLPEVRMQPAARSQFERRFRAELEAPASRRGALRRALRRFKGPRSLAMVAAGLTAIAVVMIAPPRFSPRLAGPPSVSAAEFLQQARKSAETIVPGSRSVIHQRIEIRHGARSFQREVVRAPNAKTAVHAETALLVLPGLPRVAPIDWADPLDAAAFATWHDSLAAKADSVRLNSGTMTLSTAPSAADQIVSASLTVRDSDWHAIEKTVALYNGPALQIRELSYEIRLEPQPEPLARDATSSELSHPDVTPVSHTDLHMEASEVSLRETLHRIGADTHEAPRIWRERGSLHLNAWAENDGRAQDLRLAIAELPNVQAEIHGPGALAETRQTSATPPPVEATPSTVHVTHPPLTEQLWKRLGGMDPANRYLAELGSDYSNLLAAASALDRLAERYSPAEIEKLPEDLRQRISLLAGDQITIVRLSAERYDHRLATVLKDMAGAADTPDADVSPRGACGTWQTLAPAIVAETQALQRSFHRLFVAEQVDQPVNIPAEDLLHQAGLLRAGLLEHILELCNDGQAH